MSKKKNKKSSNTGFHPLYDSDSEFERLAKLQPEAEPSIVKSQNQDKGNAASPVISKASVCLTVLNEERTIGRLLDSLIDQTSKPREIIIVDGGSKDQTVNIIKHYQEKAPQIKLFEEKLSRAKGRNLCVEVAKSEIIAMTDAGCIAEGDWLENITEPFRKKDVGIVAGFYDMTGSSSLQKAFAIFLGVTPSNFDLNFLPSTRSIAFRRRVWDKVGRFPVRMSDTAEDTLFNFNVIRSGLTFTRVKKARVEWIMPDRLSEGLIKIYKYAKGDAQSGIWVHPSKGLVTHNIKVTFKIVRYTLGLTLLLLGFLYPVLITFLALFITFYIIKSFMKVYSEDEDVKAGFWGIVLQFTTDFASMAGFLDGLIPNNPETRLKESVRSK